MLDRFPCLGCRRTFTAGAMYQHTATNACVPKFSPAQLAFLDVVRRQSYRTPFIGGRDAGRVACLWYRTAAGLEARGFVVTEREGDAKRAHITVRGLKALEQYEAAHGA
jgi:hypothetical protein